MNITTAQIKKIHTLVNSLKLTDDMYRALLYKYGAESSKELSKNEAIKLIDELVLMKKEVPTKKITGVNEKGRLIYFNRRNKITDNQIDYIARLWFKLSDSKDYKSLMWFAKRITKKLYIHIESITRNEASGIIVALENWNKQKEIKR